MKKITMLIVYLFTSTILLANDESAFSLGSVIYSPCKFCHGIKAEKTYINVVPAIRDMDVNAIESVLRLYKKGELDTYGYGSIMKMQMRNIPEDKIATVSKYIKNL